MVRNSIRNEVHVKQMLTEHPNLKSAKLQSTCILSAFCIQSDWGEVEKEAEATLNRKWISNQKEKLKRDIEPVGHNFEAIITFKEYCDKKDKFYIYKVNDKRGNPDKPLFIFKTSTQKMKIALNLNRHGDHFLNDEFCFFDGKYNRCRGFITLTVSVYHVLLRKQVVLATMEVEAETAANVALFWTLFNEALQKVFENQDKLFQ